MPKQIKKDIIHPKEKMNRIFAILSMCTAIIMCAFLIFVMPRMIKTESIGLTFLFTIAFALFFVSCFIHCFSSIGSFKATSRFSLIFQGFVSLVSTIFCIFNTRFILVMLFSALKKTDIVKVLLGTKSMVRFLESQYTNWICFIFALIAMIIVGVLGIIRLARK